MDYQEAVRALEAIPNRKTKDIDLFNKRIIKQGEDVRDLKSHVLENQLVHRTYFQVSLGQMADIKEQFQFIEENEDLLNDWWHVDQLTQFIKKPMDFDYAFVKAKKYTLSPKTFTRRWGYVLFLTGLQKDKSHTKDILSLIKNDGEYYVQMAQAWLIADLGVFNIDEVVKFIENSPVNYKISGKAIQKLCDSFRIDKEVKEYLKSLRSKIKFN